MICLALNYFFNTEKIQIFYIYDFVYRALILKEINTIQKWQRESNPLKLKFV